MTPAAFATLVGPTVVPASAVRIAVQAPDNSIQFVDVNGNESTIAKLAGPVDLTLISPPGNVLTGTVYLPISGPPGGVVRVDANGLQELDWVEGPVTGLAVGGTGLAWGTFSSDGSSATSRLLGSGLDGSQRKVLLEEKFTAVPQVFKPVRWSQAATLLYFTRDPLGLGGYILFGGWTNLWSYDMARGQATELVPAPQPNAAVCMDDLSPNERLVADHCNPKTIAVLDLTNRQKMTMNPPADVPAFGAVGGARFSPDSSRLAYGLARQDPNAEQGWVAVSEGLTGTSRLIATSPAGDYFSVAAWLDLQTLVLQSNGSVPGVWTVGVDGSGLKRIADGSFVGFTRSTTRTVETPAASRPTPTTIGPGSPVTPAPTTVTSPAATPASFMAAGYNPAS